MVPVQDYNFPKHPVFGSPSHQETPGRSYLVPSQQDSSRRSSDSRLPEWQAKGSSGFSKPIFLEPTRFVKNVPPQVAPKTSWRNLFSFRRSTSHGSAESQRPLIERHRPASITQLSSPVFDDSDEETVKGSPLAKEPLPSPLDPMSFGKKLPDVPKRAVSPMTNTSTRVAPPSPKISPSELRKAWRKATDLAENAAESMDASRAFADLLNQGLEPDVQTRAAINAALVYLYECAHEAALETFKVILRNMCCEGRMAVLIFCFMGIAAWGQGIGASDLEYEAESRISDEDSDSDGESNDRNPSVKSFCKIDEACRHFTACLNTFIKCEPHRSFIDYYDVGLPYLMSRSSIAANIESCEKYLGGRSRERLWRADSALHRPVYGSFFSLPSSLCSSRNVSPPTEEEVQDHGRESQESKDDQDSMLERNLWKQLDSTTYREEFQSTLNPLSALEDDNIEQDQTSDDEFRQWGYNPEQSKDLMTVREFLLKNPFPIKSHTQSTKTRHPARPGNFEIRQLSIEKLLNSRVYQPPPIEPMARDDERLVKPLPRFPVNDEKQT